MPNNNLTEQIAQLLGVKFPPSLDPSAIKSLLGLSGAPSSDAADALAVAICHANHIDRL